MLKIMKIINRLLTINYVYIIIFKNNIYFHKVYLINFLKKNLEKITYSKIKVE